MPLQQIQIERVAMATLRCSWVPCGLSPADGRAGRLWRFVAICWLGSNLWLIATPARAVPAFARQTGQSCVACHAGGQFPELTPYGRIFKLTGYTFGEHANPVSAMVVADWTANSNNSDGMGGQLTDLDRRFIADFGSVFLAGKITDNIGGFGQWTYAVHDHQNASGNWVGQFGSDNFDLRYAHEDSSTDHGLIWGLTLHNNPTVQDIWNSTPAWGYPYLAPSGNASVGAPPSTLIEGALAASVAGVGAYALVDRAVYLEFTNYQTAKGPWSFLSIGKTTGDPDNPLTYVQGWNPYLRLAYTREWGPQNIMLGAFDLHAGVLPLDGNNNPIYGQGATHYHDSGIDAQYQYLLSPHTFTAQLRWVHEAINDDTQNVYSAPATLDSVRLKGTYVYQEKYGVSLAYTNVTGSPDPTAYAGSAINSPNTIYWTPELFWMPLNNLRIGLQFNLFTRYLGARTNYDGNGRNATDNNNLFLYLWLAI
jgi:hypothetical protein